MRQGPLVVATALGVLLSTAAAPAAPAPTADQQLVAGLEDARTGARAVLRSLAPPSARAVVQATSQLQQATGAVGRAAKLGPRAIGALETPSVREALTTSPRLMSQAKKDLALRRYSGVRAKLQRAITLTGDALADFGRPLEKHFASFAVNRDFAYLPQFANYSGVSARVGKEITEVVIGAADRTTANVGEPGVMAYQSGGLPITRISVAVISDPIGRFNSGWCTLDAGVITCRIRPAMPADRIFTIAFAPKLARGTKLLVKFRTAAGERSFAVFTTR